MHFKLGKPKEKHEKEKIDAGLNDIAADRIVKMEKRLHGRTRDLEEKAQQIQGLAGVADKPGDIPLGPHGPIGELTLEASDKTGNLAALAAVTEIDDSEEDVKVKLVEVSGVSAPPPIKSVKLGEIATPPAKSPEITKDIKLAQEIKKEAKPDDSNDSLGNLFSQNEEEINPLANLIDSLPDVSAQELIDDLKEIKRIIKEWQKK